MLLLLLKGEFNLTLKLMLAYTARKQNVKYTEMSI